MQITITEANAPKLNKANARDVAMCRRLLAAGEFGAYARGMSGIHRSSNFRQQQAVCAAIREDSTGRFFARHPQSGAMISAVVS
jgi:hypothetical protein